MGEAALKSHAIKNPPDIKPTKHQQRLEEQRKSKRALSVLHFVNNTNSSNDATEPLPSSGNLESYVIPLSVVTAEIRWVMKVVASHFSFRSCLDLKELFQKKFF